MPRRVSKEIIDAEMENYCRKPDQQAVGMRLRITLLFGFGGGRSHTRCRYTKNTKYKEVIIAPLLPYSVPSEAQQQTYKPQYLRATRVFNSYMADEENKNGKPGQTLSDLWAVIS